MILFLAHGQLGNQISQYSFVKTLQKNNEHIITSGLRNLREIFDIDDHINISNKNRVVRAILYYVVKYVLRFLGRHKIISYICQDKESVLNGAYERTVSSYSKTLGLFKNIKFVDEGCFQSESFFDKRVVEHLHIKESYLNNAKEILAGINSNYNKVFVHLRRGDYMNYKVFGKDTILPIGYFFEQIEWFNKNATNCFFIFLSDDPRYVEDNFSSLINKIIVQGNHYGTDFALMTLCDGAILSPSSFGWWGAYLMKNRNAIIAPKYWLGFNSKIEYPKFSVPSFFTVVDVKVNNI